jgi:hypothetical protein
VNARRAEAFGEGGRAPSDCRRSARLQPSGLLSSTFVGFHAREWWTRFAASAFALAMLAPPVRAQSSPFVDLAPDLVSKIAPEIAAGASIRLSCANQERVRAEAARLLAARGFRIADGGDATVVTCSCDANLRERVCAASIVRGDVRRVVMATRALTGTTEAARDPVVAIELQPIYTQQRPMLDVAVVNNQLLVLSPDSVSLVADMGGGSVTGRTIASRPIATSRVWPRDLRGMLRARGSAFEAYLPGVICRGTVSPFTLSCADESEPWPIGLDNSGLTPSRNTFATPEGVTFYEAARLVDGRWVVVGDESTLTLLDERRRATTRTEHADHVAAFPDGCGGQGSYVVWAPGGPQAGGDTFWLSRVEDERLIQTPTSVAVPGVLLSLWQIPGERSATAIVHDVTAGRYEAFHLTLSCAR